ncbi:MAG: cation-efflux pump [Chloroflexi bacterium]|nr:cation-efflux pump [Chloroflexota bacterium]
MTRSQLTRRVLLIVLGLNVLITIVKLIIGFATGALSVIADGFHSIIDSSSNIIGLLGLWVASRPPDSNHPYGHRKYETVATLAIGGMLLLVSWEIVQSIIARLTAPAAPEVSPLDIAIMAATFVVNLAIVLYETQQGRALHSDILLADAAHTRTDLFVTVSVVVSLIAARAGFGWVDLIVAAGVVVLIVFAAYDILKRTSYILTDASVINPYLIEKTASAVPGVRYAHRARSRGAADSAYIDVHVKVDPAMSTAQAHAIASEVERRLQSEVPGVVDAVVHIEPATGAPPTEWEAITVRIRAEADALGVGVHDLHIHEEKSGLYCVEMHVEVPAALSLGEAHAIADTLERRIRQAMPRIDCVTTHIEPLRDTVPDEDDPTQPDALESRIREITDSVTGAGAAHDIQVHHISGHIAATVHVTQSAAEPLTAAHALAEEVERRLHANLPQLNRVVVHIEPPE